MADVRPSSNRFKNRLMRDAAADHLLITVRCNLCHRSVNYWAADLLRVVGPLHQVHLPPFPCGKCRTAEYLDVTWRVVNVSEPEGLTVRRPVRQITKWLWRNERT